MKSEPTVYIVDDDSSVRTGMTRLLMASGLKTASFESAQEFLDTAPLHEPGCILLDIRMPGMSGPELQEKLLTGGCLLPIIFLSAHGDVPLTVEAMKKGAVDFFTKPVDCDDLLAAVNRSFDQNEKLRAKRSQSRVIQEKLKALTPREFQIMTYVITGLLNKQIGTCLGITEDTVKIHRGRVMRKLDMRSVADLVRACERADVDPADIDRDSLE